MTAQGKEMFCLTKSVLKIEKFYTSLQICFVLKNQTFWQTDPKSPVETISYCCAVAMAFKEGMISPFHHSLPATKALHYQASLTGM